MAGSMRTLRSLMNMGIWCTLGRIRARCRLTTTSGADVICGMMARLAMCLRNDESPALLGWRGACSIERTQLKGCKDIIAYYLVFGRVISKWWYSYRYQGKEKSPKPRFERTQNALRRNNGVRLWFHDGARRRNAKLVQTHRRRADVHRIRPRRSRNITNWRRQ